MRSLLAARLILPRREVVARGGELCHTHRIMSQSVRTKNKPPRASGPPKDDRFWTGERLGKLETEVVHIKDDIVHIKEEIVHIKDDIGQIKENIAQIKESVDSLKEITKADIAALRENTKADIARLTESTKADIAALKESTKADLLKTENRILRWVVGSMGTLIISILGLIAAFILRSL